VGGPDGGPELLADRAFPIGRLSRSRDRIWAPTQDGALYTSRGTAASTQQVTTEPSANFPGMGCATDTSYFFLHQTQGFPTGDWVLEIASSSDAGSTTFLATLDIGTDPWGCITIGDRAFFPGSTTSAGYDAMVCGGTAACP